MKPSWFVKPVVNSGIVISHASAAIGSHVPGRQSTPMIVLIASNSRIRTVSMCSKPEVSMPGKGKRSTAARNGAVSVPTTTIRSPSRGRVSRPQRRRSGASGAHSAAITQATGKSAIHEATVEPCRYFPLGPPSCSSRLLVSVALM